MKSTGKSAKKSPAARNNPSAGKQGDKTQRSRKASVMEQPEQAKPGMSFTKRELEEIRVKLDEMRDSLSKNVEDKKNMDIPEPEVGDSIDQATQSLDKEILFELSDNERKMLDSIDAALRKIENGSYGICEHCKRPIDKKRLKALPSARYCMVCQGGAERTRE